MPVALGFVETDSFFGAVEASNVMAGISNIVLLGKEILSPGSITIKIIGEKEAVEAAVNAGTEAVKKLGRTISSHIIAEPDEQVLTVLPEISSFYFFLKKNSKKKIKKPPTGKPEAEVEKTKVEIEKPETEVKESKVEKLKAKIVKPKAVKTETGRPRSIKPESKRISKEKPVNEEQPIVEQPVIEKSEPVIKKIAEDLSPAIDISIKDKTEKELTWKKPAAKIAEEKIPGTDEKKRASYKNDTIERLRKEALGLSKQEKKKPARKEASGLNKPEKKKPLIEAKEKKEKNKIVIRPALESLNVHKLRSLARSTKNFPIQGREISKANRNKLLEYFKGLE